MLKETVRSKVLPYHLNSYALMIWYDVTFQSLFHVPTWYGCAARHPSTCTRWSAGRGSVEEGGRLIDCC
jgi:hypothetical protein